MSAKGSLGIANKFIHLLAIPSSFSRSYSIFPLCSGDSLNWNSCIQLFRAKRAFAHDVTAAMLVFQFKIILIRLFCLEHQHCRHGFCWVGPWGMSANALYPGDRTVSKRTGTSNRIEIQFRTFNHLSRPDSFAKLFETLCLCLAQGN
jgi:hypothetical protein